MKKILSTILLGGIALLNAQVIIGDAVGTVPIGSKASVLLEFAKGSGTGNKGIVLPYVTTYPPTTPGTIILDATDATKARVRFYNNTEWKDLSGQDANVTSALTVQTPATESTTARAIIGDVPNPIPGSFPDGVLVLNSSTKAMVLPQVADVQDIIKPSPGMMVYINKAGAKRLAVFNGSKWSYWKP